jgi:cyclic-di-AMP phosphodiesterase PgpH
MSANANSPEKTSSRPRSEYVLVGGQPRIFDALDDTRWFKVALGLVLALVMGLTLLPYVEESGYPTAREHEGTPAQKDFKAKKHAEIVDEDATNLLIEEARVKVPRVYDFDPNLGALWQQRLGQAMREARQALAVGKSPTTLLGGKDVGSGVSNSLAARSKTGAQGVYEHYLGERLDKWEVSMLERFNYGQALEEMGIEVLGKIYHGPIWEGSTELSRDEAHGIDLRTVGGSTKRRVVQVSEIGDLQRARLLLIEELNTRARLWQEESHPQGPIKLTSVDIKALVSLTGRWLKPNVTLNQKDTDLARQQRATSVPSVMINIKRGQMIVRDGDVLTDRHLLILRHMAKVQDDSSRRSALAGGCLLVLILMCVGYTFGTQRRKGGMDSRDGLFLSLLFLSALLLAKLWMSVGLALELANTGISPDILFYTLPVAGGAMVARLVLRVETALIFAVVTSTVLGLMLQSVGTQGVLMMIYALVGSVMGAIWTRDISRRSDLTKIGIKVGGLQALTVAGIQLFLGQGDWVVYLESMGAALLSGMSASFVALALTPMVESLFRYTTDLKLLELASLNHPALKELIVQAPGTYHHSIIVGSLVEAAADAVGANALKAKVMAYYHDLGKGCNAMYFIENQKGSANPHDKLKPSMSAMVIKRHVTDGLEIAKGYRLGQEILSGIAEHHGTTLIQYFYHRALEEAGEEGVVNEIDYRYPGRRPQSRESALVMLGDSVEAAARSIPDPTTARLQGMVNKVINAKFTDGQLEQCDLTLRDLHTIAKAFMHVLTSIYHHRVEYPEPAKVRRLHEDTDSKSSQASAPEDSPDPGDGPSDIPRLGLSGR